MSPDPTPVDDPLTAYDEWLKSIKTPGAHRASVVFCTYWLATEITGLTVSASIVDTYGKSTRATAETIAAFIRDCADENHKFSLDGGGISLAEFDNIVTNTRAARVTRRMQREASSTVLPSGVTVDGEEVNFYRTHMAMETRKSESENSPN